MKYLIIQQVSAEISPSLQMFDLESKLLNYDGEIYPKNIRLYFIKAKHIRLKAVSNGFVEVI
jgi:hypothetical protein